MANLPLDKLPDSFETVVYGTGITGIIFITLYTLFVSQV